MNEAISDEARMFPRRVSSIDSSNTILCITGGRIVCKENTVDDFILRASYGEEDKHRITMPIPQW
jgi:hypothetical protein